MSIYEFLDFKVPHFYIDIVVRLLLSVQVYSTHLAIKLFADLSLVMCVFTFLHCNFSFILFLFVCLLLAELFFQFPCFLQVICLSAKVCRCEWSSHSNGFALRSGGFLSNKVSIYY